MIKQGKFQSQTIGLLHYTAPCPILVMPSARLASDKYQGLGHRFDLVRIRIPRHKSKVGRGSTHSAIASNIAVRQKESENKNKMRHDFIQLQAVSVYMIALLAEDQTGWPNE